MRFASRHLLTLCCSEVEPNIISDVYCTTVNEERGARPGTVQLKDAGGRWVATFTKGAYTVAMAGPVRTFTEPRVSPVVTHTAWIRTLPVPFSGRVNAGWVAYARRANRRRYPDVLAIAMQYVSGAPPIFMGQLQIAGDASYGPLVEGDREEGSDFNDYLGVEWTYRERVDKPEKRQFRCLDCSGFIRMVWGYRPHLPGDEFASVIPLCLKPRRSRRAMPRRAFEICKSGPGVAVIEDAGVQVEDFSRIGIGDLVFFDADSKDGSRIDHVGMYLGRDSQDHHRFISSRKRANGPTMGDLGGKSILDGKRDYAKAFRAVRRI
jgi:cell wall-associated NlpC family hydrolase